MRPQYQYPDLPTGCEVTSLSMFLSWAVDALKLDFTPEQIDKMALAKQIDKEPIPHFDPKLSGQQITEVGGNPNRAFVGNGIFIFKKQQQS